jgi:hypothetical protein
MSDFSSAVHTTADRRTGWVGGLAEWVDEETRTAYLSIAFTWRLREAREKAIRYADQGYRVRAGGPGTFRPHGYLKDVAELGGQLPDAVRRHHPYATVASRGCPENCPWCIVPAMWGTTFTLLPEFPLRPVLCDDNLSALSIQYQTHIIERYRAADMPLMDANSGFAPRSFDGGTFERWSEILRGPWRFGYDTLKERADVQAMMSLLRSRGVRPRKIQVYVMIGHEPPDTCLQRIQEVIAWGGEPYVQRHMKLNALEKEPWVRPDLGWTARSLRDMARWANRRIWRRAPFCEYDASVKSPRRNPAQQELFA